MLTYMLAGLTKIELPGHTARLCDGAFVDWGAERFTSKDAVLGTLLAWEEIGEAVGDQMPAFGLSFLTPGEDVVASADLIAPGVQGSRVRLWLAELDPDTGLLVEEPDQQADMIVDVPSLTWDAQGRRILELSCVSAWQRLFDLNEGNTLSGAAHKRIFPSEQGLDNTTGVASSVAWGARGPRGIR